MWISVTLTDLKIAIWMLWSQNSAIVNQRWGRCWFSRMANPCQQPYHRVKQHPSLLSLNCFFLLQQHEMWLANVILGKEVLNAWVSVTNSTSMPNFKGNRKAIGCSIKPSSTYIKIWFLVFILNLIVCL